MLLEGATTAVSLPFALALTLATTTITATTVGVGRGGATGRRRAGAGQRDGGVDRSKGSVGGDHGVGGKANFLEPEGIVRRGEVRKNHRVGDDGCRICESWVETTKQIQHKLRLGDGLANVAEGVDRLLHLLGVSVYGEISLHHGMELLSQDKYAGGLVHLE